MAVTGFWPVYRNLKATLDCADNPDKTTLPEYLDEDLYAALQYVENDDKTDRQVFVSGINCSKQNAYAEMIAVQRRFGLRGKVVGYHGIQSFREGEVTPEQAFEIGKETARRMWGDRYQVLVTVHLNTDNIHCHFVVNPVSFKDGTKFQNKIGDHKELRRVSDQICREHGLFVLENSNFYGGNKKDYWRHKSGRKTHRDYLREDVEYCLSFATSPREFENQLYALGYTLDPVRFSVKAKHWECAVRLNNIGFSKDRVNAQLRQNAENRYRLFTLEYRPPYKPKKFPLEDELRKLGFSIEHSYDAATVLVDAVFYLVITVIQIVAELADVMLKLRKTPKRIDTLGEANPLTGLLYCADCGAKMYNQRSRGTESKPYPYDVFECSTYKLAGQKRSAACCGHHISTKALRTLILDTIRTVSTFAISNQEVFMEKVRSASQLRQAEAAKDAKRKLSKDKKRITELDTIIKKLYESVAVGRITDERFDSLLADYEAEQKTLQASVTEAEERLSAFAEDSARVEQFLELARKYTDFSELTTPMINEFIEKIIVHAPERIEGDRVQEVEIHLRFIGQFELPAPELSEEEIKRQGARKKALREAKNEKEAKTE